MVEVGSHIVSDGYHESSDLCEVALVTIFSVKQFEFDHVPIVAATNI